MTEGIFVYEKECSPETAAVTGVLQERRHIVVPEKLGGVPVRRIAPHAFNGLRQLRSISFPPGIESVGAFALHNCPQLEEAAFYDGIEDFHNGVLRQDVRLRRIRLHVKRGSYTVMRDILSDTDARLLFCLQLPDGEAKLLFPGYDYAFAENTMARTIQFSISGSGMVYRECVRRKGIGFREYDRLFARVIHDDPHAAVEIAANRLQVPYDLAPVHARAYKEYLRDNAEDALVQIVTDLSSGNSTCDMEEGYEHLHLMADRGLISREAADAALRLASDKDLTEVCSIIMAGREKTQGTSLSMGSGMLSLDDW